LGLADTGGAGGGGSNWSNKSEKKKKEPLLNTNKRTPPCKKGTEARECL